MIRYARPFFPPKSLVSFNSLEFWSIFDQELDSCYISLILLKTTVLILDYWDSFFYATEKVDDPCFLCTQLRLDQIGLNCVVGERPEVYKRKRVTSSSFYSKSKWNILSMINNKIRGRGFNTAYYPPITYCWTGLLTLDHSYIVGNLTNSKIAETKDLEPLKSWHFCISNFWTC